MSQMPDSVYMHKDAKYNTYGIDTVYSENYLLAENDFNKECLEDYVEYTPVYRLEEAVNHIKQELIEKAVEWLENNIIGMMDEDLPYIQSTYDVSKDEFIEDFKKAIEE